MRRKQSIDSTFNEHLSKLKTDNSLKAQDIDREINEFNKLINQNVTLLRRKLAQQQRLQSIQEQMEREKKLKEEQEKQLRELQEIKRRKAQIEERHRLEAIARAQRETKDLKAEQEKQNREDIETEDQMFRLEQERRDHELASRLAQDSSISDDWQSSLTMLSRSAALMNFFEIIFRISFV